MQSNAPHDSTNAVGNITSNFDNLNISDVIPATPEKPPRKERSRKCLKPISKKSENHNFLISSHRHVHNKENLPNATNSGTAYKYCYLSDIFNCTDCFLPLNKSIKLIGRCKHQDASTLYMVEHPVKSDPNQIVKIMLYFKPLSSIPKVDDTVEAFGCLSFHTNTLSKRPVFIVDFWRSLHGNVDRYISCLSRISEFITNK